MARKVVPANYVFVTRWVGSGENCMKGALFVFS